MRYLMGIAVLVALVAAGATQGAAAADRRDRTIVPGVRVGAVTARSTLAELRRIYGRRHVRPQRVPVGEGEYVDGLVLFPGTRAEVQFRFAEHSKRIGVAVIEKRKSPWRTRRGIRIGTTGARLERLNGRPFTLYGFDWDYSGRLASWNGGRLPKALIPDFRPTAKLPDKVAEKVAGDGKFSSANPVMRRSRIVVRKLLIVLQ